MHAACNNGHRNRCGAPAHKTTALFCALTLSATTPAIAQTAASAQNPVAMEAPVSTETLPPKPYWIDGTDIELMVIKEVNSRTAKPGDAVKLRVNAPVLFEGVTAIPVGATAWGEVVEVRETKAAGGKGMLSIEIRRVETKWGDLPLTGTKARSGDANTEGVAMSVFSFGILGLFMKGTNATFKAGDIIRAYIAPDETHVPDNGPLPVTVNGTDLML